MGWATTDMRVTLSCASDNIVKTFGLGGTPATLVMKAWLSGDIIGSSKTFQGKDIVRPTRTYATFQRLKVYGSQPGKKCAEIFVPYSVDGQQEGD